MTESLDVAAAQRHLDAFLVENQELESLNARLASFNLFRVLRVDTVEIRHSNVLAWLLSPDGSHGLGPVFLRRFLSRLLLDHETTGITLTPSQIELRSLADAEVLREWQNIDVLVRSASQRWCLLIENKIRGKEGRDQLTRYVYRVRREMPDFQIIPVYLTLEGDDPSDAGSEIGFLPMSHAQVLELADQIIRQHSSRIPDDARTFLDHYLETLRRLTMQDEELITLCKTIYRKHREAIDLIVEYGAASNVQDACIQEIESQIECEFVKPAAGAVWFLPKSMGSLIPSQALTAWKFLPREVPVMVWVGYLKKRGVLRLILEVGPLADSTKRKSLLHAIEAAGIPVRATGFRDDAKFTRIASHSQKLKLDEDGEPDTSDEEVQRVFRALWKKYDEPLEKVVSALSNFDWK